MLWACSHQLLYVEWEWHPVSQPWKRSESFFSRKLLCFCPSQVVSHDLRCRPNTSQYEKIDRRLIRRNTWQWAFDLATSWVVHQMSHWHPVCPAFGPSANATANTTACAKSLAHLMLWQNIAALCSQPGNTISPSSATSSHYLLAGLIRGGSPALDHVHCTFGHGIA